jgi:hypothetical protein
MVISTDIAIINRKIFVSRDLKTCIVYMIIRLKST